MWPNPPKTERGHVWIVEDSPLEAEMTRRALSSAHDGQVFPDGAIMLERLASSPPPDLILLDLELPGVSGLDTCRAIRAHHDAMSLPILVLTIHGRDEPMLESLAAGANDYVSKPFEPRELVARVTALVRTTRLYRAHNERTQQLALAADVGLAITEGALDQVARRVTQHIVDRVGAAGAAVAVARGAEFAVLAHVGDERAARACAGAVAEGVTRVPLSLQGNVVGMVAVAGDQARRDERELAAAIEPVPHLLALAIARANAEAERRDAFERERTARAAAETADRAKDEFLAVLSHELRTPLNAIVGWTSLLRSGALPPERTRDALEKVERNALSQAQLIDDLLDISRIITGKMTLARASVDVAGAARAALASVELAASRKGVQLDLDLDERASVLGDAARIQQIVWNLLSNAVRFTPATGVVALRVAREGGDMTISVRDTGQGISTEFLPHVFERFVQANTGKARAHGGLGLGLAIVKQLVELHGGTVQAASEGLGKGATFTVRMPLHVAAPARPPDASAVHDASSPALQGTRILVVDDERDARELLAFVLELHGAQVTMAGSASEALDIMRGRHFDALVSDIGMPGEDGMWLVRRARALQGEAHRLPAVALTAYARELDRERALDAGFDAHVTKPLDADALLSALRTVMPSH